MTLHNLGAQLPRRPCFPTQPTPPRTSWISKSPAVNPLLAKEAPPSKCVSPLAKATRNMKISKASATRRRSSSQENLESGNRERQPSLDIGQPSLEVGSAFKTKKDPLAEVLDSSQGPKGNTQIFRYLWASVPHFLFLMFLRQNLANRFFGFPWIP